MVKERGKPVHIQLGKKRNHWKYILGVILLVIIAVILFFVLYKSTSPTCEDQECFFSKLAVCEPSKFVYYGNITFSYIIQGREGDYCNVNVKLIRSYWRGSTFDTLNGKTMNCQVNYGQTIFPEEDLNNCHGQLKESLQEMILQKLHGYILDNLAI